MGFITSKSGWKLFNSTVTAGKAPEIQLWLRGQERAPEQISSSAIAPEWAVMEREFKASREFAKYEKLKAALLANEAAQAEARQQLEASEELFANAVGEGDQELAYDACPTFSSQRVADLQQEHRVIARACHAAYHETKTAFLSLHFQTRNTIMVDAGEQRRKALEKFLAAASPLLDELAHAALRQQKTESGPTFESVVGSLPGAAVTAAREAARERTVPVCAGDKLAPQFGMKQ